MHINGHTRFLTLLGQPISTVKAPMIYNPYFKEQEINTVLLPMEVKPEQLTTLLSTLFTVPNFVGSLITMPHKISVMEMLDVISPAAAIAGSCNAVRRDQNGRLVGDMFDGEGFIRGMLHKGYKPAGKKALVIGAGGVGCAIAASVAAAGITKLGLYDVQPELSQALAQRLQQHYPQLHIQLSKPEPNDFDIIVNATPMGMQPDDPLPLDVSQLTANMFVGDVVMKNQFTPFLQAAQKQGCMIQIGTDMLFEQIPAYLEFFNLPATTATHLREVACIQYL